jgi:hypothetical protein
MSKHRCDFRSYATQRIAFFPIAWSSSTSCVRRCASRTSWSSSRSVPLATYGRLRCCRTMATHRCSVVSGMPKSRALQQSLLPFGAPWHCLCFKGRTYFAAIVCTLVGMRVSSPSSRCPWNSLTSIAPVIERRAPLRRTHWISSFFTRTWARARILVRNRVSYSTKF